MAQFTEQSRRPKDDRATGERGSLRPVRAQTLATAQELMCLASSEHQLRAEQSLPRPSLTGLCQLFPSSARGSFVCPSATCPSPWDLYLPSIHPRTFLILAVPIDLRILVCLLCHGLPGASPGLEKTAIKGFKHKTHLFGILCERDRLPTFVSERRGSGK